MLLRVTTKINHRPINQTPMRILPWMKRAVSCNLVNLKPITYPFHQASEPQEPETGDEASGSTTDSQAAATTDDASGSKVVLLRVRCSERYADNSETNPTGPQSAPTDDGAPGLSPSSQTDPGDPLDSRTILGYFSPSQLSKNLNPVGKFAVH